MPTYVYDEVNLVTDFYLNGYNNSGYGTVSPTYPPWEPFAEWHQRLWYIGFAVIVILAVVFNFMVLCFVLCDRRMRNNVTNYPIISLAVADLLTSLINTPLNLYMMMNNDWILNDFCCKLNQYLSNVFIATSAFTPCATSVDRFIGLAADPMRQKMTKKQIIFVIVLIWVLSFIGSIPYYNNFKKVPVLESNSFNIPFTAVTYVVPVLVMARCYAGVATTLRKSKGISGPREDRKKVIKMLIVVVAVFAICWLPFHIYFLVEGFWPTLREQACAQLIYFWCYGLAMFNSAANPLVYCCFLPTFRNRFKKVFCFFRRDNSSNLLSSSTRHNRSITLATCVTMDSSGSEPQRHDTTPSVRNKVAWFKGQESVQVY